MVGVGLENGHIHIHNLRKDATLMTFHQTGSAVTSLTFRTGETHRTPCVKSLSPSQSHVLESHRYNPISSPIDQQPFMASASTTGTVTVWDLEKRRVSTVIEDCHRGRVLSAQFLHGQPVLLTSGEDNTVKMWAFDQTDGGARVLRSRSGHYQPPSRVRFYGEAGKHLLTAGKDRTLRFFSTIADQQNVELSQGSVSKKAKKLQISAEMLKLPEISDFASGKSPPPLPLSFS